MDIAEDSNSGVTCISTTGQLDFFSKFRNFVEVNESFYIGKLRANKISDAMLSPSDQQRTLKP